MTSRSQFEFRVVSAVDASARYPPTPGTPRRSTVSARCLGASFANLRQQYLRAVEQQARGRPVTPLERLPARLFELLCSLRCDCRRGVAGTQLHAQLRGLLEVVGDHG